MSHPVTTIQNSGSVFCYEEHYRNPSQRLGCQCEDRVICIYFICLIYGHRLPCCRLCYLAQSILCQAHQKHFVVRAVCILTLWYLTHLSMVTKCLWWTCRALPPGLELLRFEGITTITHSIYLFSRFVNCFGDDVIDFLICIGDLFQLRLAYQICAFQFN